jgi:hypothetical protein
LDCVLFKWYRTLHLAECLQDPLYQQLVCVMGVLLLLIVLWRLRRK